MILRADKGNRVYHITTAATIWVTAALGTACGLGAWRVAALASVLVIMVLTLGLRLDRVLFRHGEPEEDIGPSLAVAADRPGPKGPARTDLLLNLLNPFRSPYSGACSFWPPAEGRELARGLPLALPAHGSRGRL